MKEGTTLYFVRHGQTYMNYYGYMQGWCNAPLTHEGEKIVSASGRGLRHVKFDAIYTSDLSRTRDTASLILRENEETPHDMMMTAMPEFREVFYGSYEGQPIDFTYDDVAKRNGFKNREDMMMHLDTAQRINAFREADPYHEAENFKMFWHRVERGLIQVIEKHRDEEETILIVAHGGCIRYIIENIVPGFDANFPLDNASVSKVVYNQGQFHLAFFGRTDHFQ